MNTASTGTVRRSSPMPSRMAPQPRSDWVSRGGMKIAMIASAACGGPPRPGTSVVLGRRRRDHVHGIRERRLAGGRNVASSARTSSRNGTTSRPRDSHASAHMIPGPPAFVTIATRLPDGMGWLAISEATSNSSPSVSVRTTPACSKSESTVTSDAAEQRAGVRGGSACARRRTAALDREDRLRARDPAGDPAELARVSERLQIQQHQVGALVGLPVLDQVVAGDVRLVADRHERRQPEVELARA